MPELPEVEILRKYFNVAALHKGIENVRFLDEQNKIYKSSREEIKKNLIGHEFLETERIGKYFFAKISNGKWLHLHFGMTGDLEIFSAKSPEPKYSRLVIVFKDGDKLAFRDLRKFGIVEIVKDPEDYREEKGIGKDLLQISDKAFSQALKGRKTPIKNALLDQKKFAGIGNWIADEMLFEKGIHPLTQAADLSDQQLMALHQAAVNIVKKAIEQDTHYGDFPENFFVNYRKSGAIHPDHPNSPVESLKVGGRGSFIVPEKQKKPS